MDEEDSSKHYLKKILNKTVTAGVAGNQKGKASGRFCLNESGIGAFKQAGSRNLNPKYDKHFGRLL